VLTPQLRGFDTAIDRSLPYASTLCGSCAEVCPVKIPIPDILVHLRHRIVEEKKRGHHGLEQLLMALGGWAMAKGRRFGRLGGLAGFARAVLRKDYLRSLPWLGKRWTAARDLRMPPRRSFRAWSKREGKGRFDV
jgi:L-lactate dehydrogenase complex protein LldF